MRCQFLGLDALVAREPFGSFAGDGLLANIAGSPEPPVGRTTPLHL